MKLCHIMPKNSIKIQTHCLILLILHPAVPRFLFGALGINCGCKGARVLLHTACDCFFDIWQEDPAEGQYFEVHNRNWMNVKMTEALTFTRGSVCHVKSSWVMLTIRCGTRTGSGKSRVCERPHLRGVRSSYPNYSVLLMRKKTASNHFVR